jgi:hypothetical protein
MPRTPDRFPGSREEDELQLTPEASDPTIVGAVRNVSGLFRLRDNDGAFSPLGVETSRHAAIRNLIHFIDDGPAEGFASGAFKETLPAASPFPTSVIWWESSSKLKKIVEKTITRSGGAATNVTPTPIIWKVYDTDGSTVLATVSDAITYSGVFETSRVRTIT